MTRNYKEEYRRWLDSPALSESEWEELNSIANDEKEIESRFFAPLEFGTAGLRGTMKLGLHQMNVHIIRHATQAFANVIKAEGGDAMKKGIVICFDRHLPESIRTCALMGAQLVIIPTANTEAEPMELFEWEVRVQAMQNQVFVAMCNRVGLEDKMDFAGQSIVVHPSGDVIVKADNKQRLVTCDIDLAEVELWRGKRPYISTRRKDMYL